VLLEVGSVPMGELAACVMAVLSGKEGAAAVSCGLMACSGVAGWTSLQVPASPEPSVRTAYSSSFWVLSSRVGPVARNPPPGARAEAWKSSLSGVPYSALAYLRHHLALAGRDEPLFADDPIARLHRIASGLPRALNNAATAALIAAAPAGKDLVDDACAKKAVAELTRD
jgi:hypothetical protein